MLAAPEFVEPELVKVLNELQVTPELQCGVLADRVMRSEERAEFQT
jgi:hypothetical protein